MKTDSSDGCCCFYDNDYDNDVLLFLIGAAVDYEAITQCD